MARSFFLAFGNMIIYIIVAILHNALQFSYSTSYTIAIWLCLMISLCLADIMIRKKVFM
ncbi:hypothetical protein DCC39_16795 [Pueribacillus theae]|uniref:Uncharacterized protein n=1 Tax=Pueribacillus theae TaxID=2171751 RepID=A0A2U1JQ90_9BACI|nr:hypothetical protein DCC39_16795 [Pueribacillus theae]